MSLSNDDRQAVILSAARTPGGRFMGALSSLSAPDLGAVAVAAILLLESEWVLGVAILALGGCGQDAAESAAEQATEQIKDAEQLIMVGTKAPVGFFAYPGKVSEFAPEGAVLHTLAEVDEDAEDALARVCDGVAAADLAPRRKLLEKPGFMTGELSSRAIGVALAEHLPENAIVVDEAATSGMPLAPFTATAQPHDWLNLTGGAIGWGLPAAVGAAIACPDRKVLCLEGDGSAMYTIQALWTMARENLDVTVVIYNNRKYSILELEFARTGARGGKPGPNAASMLDIGSPDMDFVAMAQGMGVSASRATTVEEFNTQLEAALAASGPHLIDALVPTLLS